MEECWPGTHVFQGDDDDGVMEAESGLYPQAIPEMRLLFGWKECHLWRQKDVISPPKLGESFRKWPDSNTVDGRNPAPVDMANIPLFTRF